MSTEEMYIYMILYVFPLLTVVAIGILVMFFFLSRGIGATFIKARLSRRIPVIVHYATGKITVKLARELEGYLELGKNEYFLLPKAETGSNSSLASFLNTKAFWDGLNRPAYFMDIRKSVAVTPKIAIALNQAGHEKKITLYDGEIIDLNTLVEATQKMYKPSVLAAIYQKGKDVGRQKAGFNMANISILLGIGMLLMILCICAKWVGLF